MINFIKDPFWWNCAAAFCNTVLAVCFIIQDNLFLALLWILNAILQITMAKLELKEQEDEK